MGCINCIHCKPFRNTLKSKPFKTKKGCYINGFPKKWISQYTLKNGCINFVEVKE